MNEEAVKKAKTMNVRKCGQHLINILSSNYLGPKLAHKDKDVNPDAKAMTHGARESIILFRLCAVDILNRHFDIWEGRMAAKHGEHARSDVELLKWGFQRLSHHWHRCPRNKTPAPFDSSTIPSISNGLFAGSKLMSNRGDHSFYHLNTSTVLEGWMEQNGHVLQSVFLAFKGSRFNWHLKACPAFLLNYEVLLTFIHTLLAASDEPNRLVTTVFDFLSNRSLVTNSVHVQTFHHCPSANPQRPLSMV